MDNKKLKQYTLNQISNPSELEEVIQWIEATPENRSEYNRLKNCWAYASFCNYDDLPQKSIRKRSVERMLSLKVFRYAAVFTLAFILGGMSIYFIEGSHQELAVNEVIVPLGENAQVILPDQTHVWLNSGTRFKYPSNFTGKNRDVELFGEAYFDVEHDLGRPFRVMTENLTVKVLGTQFNIEALNDKDEVNITLIEGKVNLQTNKGQSIVELKPNQNAVYNSKSNELDVQSVDVEYYTSWTKGIMLFRDEKLADIADRLERCYNVFIEFDDEASKEIKFSGSILRNKPINQILDILKFTSNLEYTITIRHEKPNIIHLKKKPM
ncbi:FecR family protein [Sunxiuqinia elliptica]|uniref:FecR family protein n=1 Tax=Sunxiuqinia elliptica TaxID=655355 RepID=A0A1I2GS85_9BACT|nr:FecR domain-containing protein [Sunxiuqinia elliptica]SFF20465.1 FecR family protein [Sunxiuqinia elliptica]